MPTGCHRTTQGIDYLLQLGDQDFILKGGGQEAEKILKSLLQPSLQLLPVSSVIAMPLGCLEKAFAKRNWIKDTVTANTRSGKRKKKEKS